MWNIFKQPKKQFIIVSIIIALYWGWEISYSDHSEYKEVISVQSELPETSQSRVEERSTKPDTTLTDEEILEKYFPERTRSFIEEDSSTDITMELRLQFWDMVLGHLSSIMGSLAALLTPLITVFLNRKGYFKTETTDDE